MGEKGTTIYVPTELKWGIKELAVKERREIKELVQRMYIVYRELTPVERARLLQQAGR